MRTAKRAILRALLEQSGLYERLSAEDNLRFYGRVAHMPKAQLDQRIQELLTHLGLWDRRVHMNSLYGSARRDGLEAARRRLNFSLSIPRE